MDYPEHEKLAALNGANNTIGQFLDWLDQEDIILCKWDDERLVPCRENKATTIGRHFLIDEDKLEAEKQSMLASLRGEA